nr:MAG TPA: hypothetical protein [Caudoviricetes sp.]
MFLFLFNTLNIYQLPIIFYLFIIFMSIHHRKLILI